MQSIILRTHRRWEKRRIKKGSDGPPKEQRLPVVGDESWGGGRWLKSEGEKKRGPESISNKRKRRKTLTTGIVGP